MKILGKLSALALMLTAPSAFADDWSGLYGGLYGGYGFEDGNATDLWDISRGTSEPWRHPMDGESMLGGIVVGANRQFDSVVFGFEGDLGAGGRAKGLGQNSGGVDPDSHYAIKNLVSGSARARLGYAGGQFMPYVTGGAAFTLLETSANECSGPDCGFGYLPYKGKHGALGWTAGLGLEYAVTPGSTLGIEYRYTDYGTQEIGLLGPGAGGDGNTMSGSLIAIG
jgi:outer membrane immunogenic protein